MGSFPHIAEQAQHLSALTAPLVAEEAVEFLRSDCPSTIPTAKGSSLVQLAQ